MQSELLEILSVCLYVLFIQEENFGEEGSTFTSKGVIGNADNLNYFSEQTLGGARSCVTGSDRGAEWNEIAVNIPSGPSPYFSLSFPQDISFQEE